MCGIGDMRQHDRIAGQDGLDTGFERHAGWGNTTTSHTGSLDKAD